MIFPERPDDGEPDTIRRLVDEAAKPPQMPEPRPPHKPHWHEFTRADDVPPDKPGHPSRNLT
jgi:hypothetical protein